MPFDDEQSLTILTLSVLSVKPPNSAGPYGTFDQGGDVWQWNETVVYDGNTFRKLRGGGYTEVANHLHALNRFNYVLPTYEGSSGFRVVAVPEPSSLIMLAGGLVPLLSLKRRRTSWHDALTAVPRLARMLGK